MGWRKLFSDGLQSAYISEDKRSILKILNEENELNVLERAVHIWNTINPGLPKAHVLSTTINEVRVTGWVYPNVKGRQATDMEIKNALISIFNNSGRIVIKAPERGTFITTTEGQVVCLNPNMALLIEPEKTVPAIGFRKSSDSTTLWQQEKTQYQFFFCENEVSFHRTVSTIKALLCIKLYLPHLTDANVLLENDKLIVALAKAYDTQDIHEAMKLQDALLKNHNRNTSTSISYTFST